MVPCSYCDSSTVHEVLAAYPQSTLIGTPTCSSLSGTTSYETYIAHQEESGCVLLLAKESQCMRQN